MHCLRRPALLRIPLTRGVQQAPKPTIELDPSFDQLLRDTDLSLLRQRKHHPKRVIHELETTDVPVSDSLELEAVKIWAEVQEEETERREERRSTAAVYGSRRIGAVQLPWELEMNIANMIEGSDKIQLRSDAQRLYLSATKQWLLVASNSTKTRQGDRRTRDGMAYVSVGLPAQYAAVENVLLEVRNRLGPREDLGLEGWVPEHVLDFSPGASGALWASLKVFRKNEGPLDEVSLPHSTLKHYVAVNSNEGMTDIAKALTKDVDIGACTIDFTSKLMDEALPDEALSSTLAIAAFTLSQLPSDSHRRELIKSIWNSGAEVIVLIDQGTQAGFTHIAEARRRLLRYGQKEALEEGEVPDSAFPADLEEITIDGRNFVEQLPRMRLPDGTPMPLNEVKGLSHVIAPCPHDGPCPLHSALLAGGKDFCHFSQRLQRPAFVRLTKHSGQGEEDSAYSYVVIRRGKRPLLDADSERRGTGRIGGVGKEEVERERAKFAEEARVIEMGEEVVIGLPETEGESMSEVMAVDGEALRLEAYEWPRIVYPPLKRSGHVVLDMCTQEGQIERHTIPKSQGKQPYYDARKASWGDSFPHPPKNKPVIRERGIKKLTQLKGRRE